MLIECGLCYCVEGNIVLFDICQRTCQNFILQNCPYKWNNALYLFSGSHWFPFDWDREDTEVKDILKGKWIGWCPKSCLYFRNSEILNSVNKFRLLMCIHSFWYTLCTEDFASIKYGHLKGTAVDNWFESIAHVKFWKFFSFNVWICMVRFLKNVCARVTGFV